MKPLKIFFFPLPPHPRNDIEYKRIILQYKIKMQVSVKFDKNKELLPMSSLDIMSSPT